MSRNFPDWVEAYIQNAKEGSEAPLIMHFWTAVSTLASVIRRRVWIDMVNYDWTANLMIVLTGPPNVVKKSTTINAGFQFLRQIPDVHIGPDVVTPASFLQDLADATYNDPEIGINSPMTISSSELGSFLSFEDDTFISNLIDIWDGKKRPFRKRTVGRQFEEVPTPWFNLLGCTTPGWIAANVPIHALSGGLISRMIFPYAEKKRIRVPLTDEVVRPDKEEIDEKLLEDLLHISTIWGKMQISEEARVWMRDWYNKTEDKLEALSSRLDERYIHAASRKQTMLMKVAMILAVSRGDDLCITAKDFYRAMIVLDETEKSSEKAFALLGKPLIPKMVELLEEFIQQSGGRCTTEAAFNFFVGQVDWDTFEQTVTAAVKSGKVLVSRREGADWLVVRGHKVKDEELEEAM